MNTVIRPANLNDLPALTELLGILFRIEQDFLPNPDRQIKGLSLFLTDQESRHILVGLCEGKIAGMITGQLLVSTAQGTWSGLIEDLVVHPDYRLQGLGSLLLQTMVEWCSNRGASRVQLLADRDNLPALEFYASQGWQSTALQAWRKFLS